MLTLTTLRLLLSKPINWLTLDVSITKEENNYTQKEGRKRIKRRKLSPYQYATASEDKSFELQLPATVNVAMIEVRPAGHYVEND